MTEFLSLYYKLFIPRYGWHTSTLRRLTATSDLQTFFNSFILWETILSPEFIPKAFLQMFALETRLD